MDLITINELAIKTTIGVYAWEQQIQQEVIIDLCYAVDTEQAADSDELDPRFDYAHICQSLTEYVSNLKLKLLETLASQVANFLQTEFQFDWFRLTVSKPGAVKNAKRISLTIER